MRMRTMVIFHFSEWQLCQNSDHFKLKANTFIRIRIVITILYEQVDPMDDRANIAYAALPERLYVVQDGQITYQVFFSFKKKWGWIYS